MPFLDEVIMPVINEQGILFDPRCLREFVNAKLWDKFKCFLICPDPLGLAHGNRELKLRVFDLQTVLWRINAVIDGTATANENAHWLPKKNYLFHINPPTEAKPEHSKEDDKIYVSSLFLKLPENLQQHNDQLIEIIVGFRDQAYTLFCTLQMNCSNLDGILEKYSVLINTSRDQIRALSEDLLQQQMRVSDTCAIFKSICVAFPKESDSKFIQFLKMKFSHGTDLPSIANRFQGLTQASDKRLFYLMLMNLKTHKEGRESVEVTSLCKEPIAPLLFILSLAEKKYSAEKKVGNKEYLDFVKKASVETEVGHLFAVVAKQTGIGQRLHKSSFICSVLQLANENNLLDEIFGNNLSTELKGKIKSGLLTQTKPKLARACFWLNTESRQSRKDLLAEIKKLAIRQPLFRY